MAGKVLVLESNLPGCTEWGDEDVVVKTIDKEELQLLLERQTSFCEWRSRDSSLYNQAYQSTVDLVCKSQDQPWQARAEAAGFYDHDYACIELMDDDWPSTYCAVHNVQAIVCEEGIYWRGSVDGWNIFFETPILSVETIEGFLAPE